jgi:hypothetical protein
VPQLQQGCGYPKGDRGHVNGHQGRGGVVVLGVQQGRGQALACFVNENERNQIRENFVREAAV